MDNQRGLEHQKAIATMLEMLSSDAMSPRATTSILDGYTQPAEQPRRRDLVLQTGGLDPQLLEQLERQRQENNRIAQEYAEKTRQMKLASSNVTVNPALPVVQAPAKELPTFTTKSQWQNLRQRTALVTATTAHKPSSPSLDATPTDSSVSPRVSPLPSPHSDYERYHPQSSPRLSPGSNQSTDGDGDSPRDQQPSERVKKLEKQILRKDKEIARLRQHLKDVDDAFKSVEAKYKRASEKLSNLESNEEVQAELLYWGSQSTTSSGTKLDFDKKRQFDIKFLQEPKILKTIRTAKSVGTAIDKLLLQTKGSKKKTNSKGSTLSVNTAVGVRLAMQKNLKNARKAIREKHRDPEEERNRLDQARLYVRDAIIGRSVESDEYTSSSRVAFWRHKFAQLDHRFRHSIALIILLHSFLVIWEAPYTSQWAVEPYASRRKGLLLADWGFMGLHIIHAVPPLYFVGLKMLRDSKIDRAHYIMMVILFLDLSIATASDSEYLRFSRPLRPFLLVRHLGRLRKLMKLILKTVTGIATVFVLFVLILSLFALLGMMSFQGTYSSDGALRMEEFEDFLDSSLALYLLFGAENYPDISHPALDKNMGFVLYFSIYVFVSTLVISSILTADFYHAYKQHRKVQVIENRRIQRTALIAAFKNMDIDGSGTVSLEEFIQLWKKINQTISEADIAKKFAILDADNSGELDLLEFFALCDFLNEYQKEKQPSDARPATSATSSLLRDTHILAHAKFIICAAHLALLALSGSVAHFGPHFRTVSIIFSAAYAVELAIQVRTWGGRKLLTDVRLRFSFVFWVSMLIGIIGDDRTKEGDSWDINGFHYMMILPVFLVLVTIHPVQKLGANLLLALKPFVVICLLLVQIFYLFAVIGMEIFGGLGPKMNELEGFTYVYSNFDSFGGAVFLLGQIFVGSNWGDVLYAIVHASGVWSYVVYFIVFHFVSTILVRNIFIGMLLDALLFRRDVASKLLAAIQSANTVKPVKTFKSKLRTAIFGAKKEEDNYRKHQDVEEAMIMREVGSLVETEARKEAEEEGIEVPKQVSQFPETVMTTPT